MFHNIKTMYEEFITKEVGLKGPPQDMSKVIEYGKHFLALGSAHGFVLNNGYNGLDQILHIARTVDYLMGSPSLIHEITEFTISVDPSAWI